MLIFIKNKKFFLSYCYAFAAIFAISSNTVTKAVIESCALFKKDNKKVLVLGDFHGCLSEGELAELDNRDYAILINYINKISLNNIKTKMILEASEWDLNAKKELRNKGNIGAYYKLPFYAKDNNGKIKNLNFSFSDTRSAPIRNFIELFTLLDQPAFRNPVIWPQLKNQLKVLFGFEHSLSDFFNEVDSLVNIFEEKIKSIDSKEISEFMQKILVKIKEYKKIGICSISQKNRDISYIDFFTNKMTKGKIDKLINLLYIFALPLADRIADLGFILDLLNSLNKYDQLIIYAGNNHAIAINKFLRIVSFENCYIKGLTVKNKNSAVFSNSRFTANELENILNEAFTTESTSTTNSKFCSHCKLEEDQVKLSRCSACKKSFYCSVNCQRKDWNNHKQICKK